MRVMIAVDETEESVDAARCAHRLFGDDASYLIASIGEPSTYIHGLDPFGAVALDIYTLGVPSAERSRETATHAAEEAGIPTADVIAEFGLAGRQLCELCSDLNIDVLVVGNHDRGFLSRLIDPSVCHYVVDHAPCPVLVSRTHAR